MERLDYNEIKLEMENYFKNLGYEAIFSDDDDYKNMVAFWVEDNNKRIIIPKCKKSISEISTQRILEQYLQWLKVHYNLS
jgi:hypothetical protein